MTECYVLNCENKATYKKTAPDPFVSGFLDSPKNHHELTHYVCEKHKYHKPLKEYSIKGNVEKIKGGK